MRKDIIIKIENISKQYRLGLIGTGTLGHDLNRWWHKLRGKEDPYIKIGEDNDQRIRGISDYVWALRDINIEIERGEIVGVIGKNGAGKSTLLKLLSRVTSPTSGSIMFDGRVASLLEVGTGFNGEMTGRENIYLNGAILGMTKKEITSKLDEIIMFSGCERYIDTPVKRYSSGMYVRLAFAVAAFLEPEILIVDEVLAVGDAEFQKKAIGKMQDISKAGGRTVLFVSHNMAAVKILCTRGIVLENGRVIFDGDTEESIDVYASICRSEIEVLEEHTDLMNNLKLNYFNVFRNGRKLNKLETLFLGEIISIEIEIEILEKITDLSFAIDILNDKQELISHLINEDCGLHFSKVTKNQTLKLKIETNKLLMMPGFYTMNFWVGMGQMETIYKVKNFHTFFMEQSSFTKRTKLLPKHSKFYLHSNWLVEYEK